MQNMDMKVNADLIIKLRIERAWSQQHLADVCGLSIRTIGRVEKQGSASYDTLKALGAAFDLCPQDLQDISFVNSVSQTETDNTKTIDPKIIMGGAFLICLILFTAGYLMPSGTFFIENKGASVTNAEPTIELHTAPLVNITMQSESMTIFPNGDRILEGDVTLSFPENLIDSYDAIRVKPKDAFTKNQTSQFTHPLKIYVDGGSFLVNQGMFVWEDNIIQITSEYSEFTKT
jgi:DNA-binding XRE family transcriptional regulator